MDDFNYIALIRVVSDGKEDFYRATFIGISALCHSGVLEV
jgi:hypothetical protein